MAMQHGLLFFFLFLSQSAFALYGEKVVKAPEAFVVSLHNQGKKFCNGVLISPSKVLTAGHCIDMQGLENYDMSQGLIYNPHELIVRVGDKSIKAKAVTLSQTYFEGLGYETEDLALIELSAITNVTPIKFADKNDLTKNTKLTLIARGMKVEATLLMKKSYDDVTALFLEKSSGACLGDSGGAVVLNKNGQQLLAGILMYQGEEQCFKKTQYAYFPKVQF